MHSNRITNLINRLKINWSLCFIGEDPAYKLSRLLQDLRKGFSATGEGKRISSGFSYWGLGPTLAWKRACEDPFYPVMYESTRFFGELLDETFSKLESRNYHYVSLGVGTGTKDGLVLQKLYKLNNNPCYFPVDMSQEMLRLGVKEATKSTPIKRDEVLPLQIDFSSKNNVDELKDLLQGVIGDENPMIFALLGNTLSNFDYDCDLLKILSRMIRPQDKLLLEIAVTSSLSEEAQNEAAQEYDGSRMFKQFVSIALSQNTDLHVNPDNVIFVGSAEEERAILIKALYPNSGEPLKITLPDKSTADFAKNDTIRLYTMRKYTNKGINEMLRTCGFKPLSRVKREFTADYRNFSFGMEMLLLAPLSSTEKENETFTWDIFLSYSSLDKEIAEKLFSALDNRCKVFMDRKRIEPGARWDKQLPEAQRSSLMTLLLLSTNTGQADYQNEEIRIAIEMVRSAEKKHHLFPVILGDLPKESIPYGLGIRQGIPLSNDTDIESVAGAILEQLDKLKQ